MDASVSEDSTRTLRCYRLFPVTRELRVILDTRVGLREMKRWLHVGVYPAKTSTCSPLFAAHVENEAQELPCYVATEKI